MIPPTTHPTPAQASGIYDIFTRNGLVPGEVRDQGRFIDTLRLAVDVPIHADVLPGVIFHVYPHWHITIPRPTHPLPVVPDIGSTLNATPADAQYGWTADAVNYQLRQLQHGTLPL